MRVLAALVLVVVAVAAGTAPAAAQTSLPELFNQLAQKVGRIPDIRDKALGTIDFPLPSGSTSELAVFLAEQLDVSLISGAPASGYKVLTRRDLCKVIGENMLWVNDRFDDKLATKLGKLRGIDFLITGQLAPLGRRAVMSVRLVETTTGQSVWADSLEVPLDEALRSLASKVVAGNPCGNVAAATGSAASAAAVTTGDRLQVKISTDKKSYRIGDAVTFNLRVNRDAYVTLIDLGTSGDVTVLYPNPFEPNHFVPAGKDVSIPPAGSGFKLTVQPPGGLEQIRAIATVDNVKIHAQSFAGGGRFRSLDRAQTRDLAVAISDERDKIPPDRWAEDVIAVEIRDR